MKEFTNPDRNPLSGDLISLLMHIGPNDLLCSQIKLTLFMIECFSL